MGDAAAARRQQVGFRPGVTGAEFLPAAPTEALPYLVDQSALLLVGVAARGGGQLLEPPVPFGRADLPYPQQRVEDLDGFQGCVLDVLDGVRVLEGDEDGVHRGPLGLAVGDHQVREVMERGLAIGLRAAHEAEQVFHRPVILEDQLDDIPSRCHAMRLPTGVAFTSRYPHIYKRFPDMTRLPSSPRSS